MRLDEMMRDAVAPVEVDVLDIAAGARARGTVRRRQRRLAVVLAGAGAAAAVAGVTVLVAPTPGGDTVAPAAPTVASESPSPVPAADVRLDGRSTVAVLRDLLGQVGADGVTDTYGGQGAPGGAPDTYGDLHLTPPGEGLGEVGVNVQGRDMLPAVSRRCEDFMADCSVRTLPSGDVLRLYSDTDDGPGERRVAELLSERQGLRVVVAATNGLDLPSNRWDVTREGTVLDDEQLVSIATDDVWAFRVPATYAEQGADLTPYTDYDALWPDETSAGPDEIDGEDQPSAEPSE